MINCKRKILSGIMTSYNYIFSKMNDKEKYNKVKETYKNVLGILEEFEEINSLEEFCNDPLFLYTANLFILYYEYNGYDVNDAIKYLINNNIKDYKIICLLNPNFKEFVKSICDIRGFYMDHLYYLGVDFKSKNTIEINKGEYDTCITTDNTSISKYNVTNKLNNSLLFQRYGELYEVTDCGLRFVGENNTFIIHNPSSKFELFKELQLLAETNNKVIISLWGFTFDSISKNRVLKKYKEVIELITQLGINLSSNEIENSDFDNLFCKTIIVDTKKIKKFTDSSDLMTDNEKEMISKALEKHDFLESEISEIVNDNLSGKKF